MEKTEESSEKSIVPSQQSPPLPALTSLEQALLTAGFSPQLPAQLGRLNQQLSIRDRWNQETQWRSITLTLTPDPQYPQLRVTTDYREQRQAKITLFSNGRARFSILGKAPSEQMPDLIGVVGLSDMQEYARKYMFPEGYALFYNHPELSENKKEMPITEDFLNLTQEDWNKIDCRFYALNFLPGIATIMPFPVGKVIRCGIYSILYESAAKDVEAALVDFTALLERNLPGKQ